MARPGGRGAGGGSREGGGGSSSGWRDREIQRGRMLAGERKHVASRAGGGNKYLFSNLVESLVLIAGFYGLVN